MKFLITTPARTTMSNHGHVHKLEVDNSDSKSKRPDYALRVHQRVQTSTLRLVSWSAGTIHTTGSAWLHKWGEKLLQTAAWSAWLLFWKRSQVWIGQSLAFAEKGMQLSSSPIRHKKLGRLRRTDKKHKVELLVVGLKHMYELQTQKVLSLQNREQYRGLSSTRGCPRPDPCPRVYFRGLVLQRHILRRAQRLQSGSCAWSWDWHLGWWEVPSWCRKRSRLSSTRSSRIQVIFYHPSHFSSLCLAILFFCSREAVDLGFAYDRRDSVMVEICKVLCLKLKQVLPWRWRWTFAWLWFYCKCCMAYTIVRQGRGTLGCCN